MNKEKTLILDGSNIAYRVYYALAKLSHGGEPTAVIYGFPKLVHALLNQFQPTRMVVVWDGKRSKQRLDWFPGYKEGRGKTKDGKSNFDAEDFYSQKDKVVDILNCLGVHQVHNKQVEADDYIYYLSRKYSKEGTCIIVSNDSDFYQLVSTKVRIWNDNKKKLINHKNFKKILGYPMEWAMDYQILVGDKSDKIPGYPQVGEKRALEFLERWGSIESYLASKEPGEKLISREKLTEVYELNRKLMDLKFFYENYLKPSKAINKSDYSSPQINTAELKIICAQYGIRTLMQPQFLKPFKALYYA